MKKITCFLSLTLGAILLLQVFTLPLPATIVCGNGMCVCSCSGSPCECNIDTDETCFCMCLYPVLDWRSCGFGNKIPLPPLG